MSNWAAVESKLDGRQWVPHTVLTFAGTWAPPGVGYPSDVVNGLTLVVDDGLVVEVPVPAPWSFGPVGGPLDAPSYEQSVQIGYRWACNWIRGHPNNTFALGGYSQGGEAASRVLAELMTGSLTDYRHNLIGGYTFGNPWRLAGHTGPGLADPGGHGIATTNLTPNQVPDTWVDVANKGDLYTATPDGLAGQYVTDFYSLAVKAQLGNFGQFVADEIAAGQKLLGDVEQLVANPLGDGMAALQAGWAALAFFASGTAPHISYHLTEITPGRTGVQYAVDWLANIAGAVPARRAA